MKVELIGITPWNTLDCRFQEDGQDFSIKSFKDGVIFIDHISGNLYAILEKLKTLFEKDSNLYGLTAIELKFNGVLLSCNRPDEYG